MPHFSILLKTLIRKLTVSAGVILLFCIFTSSTALANNISGSVSLPNGIVAPNGGISLTVRSQLFDSFGFGFDTVTIAAGNSTANYLLAFSNDSDRVIVFDCDACASIDVTTGGGWSNSQGVVGSFSGQTFSGDQDHVVDILLETADTFRGTLSLPDGVTATGDEFLLVSISSSDLFSFASFSEGDFLAVGQSSFDFNIGAPTNLTSTGWEIRFVCLSCESRVEPESHFATSISGGTPTLDRDSAFRFDKSTDFSEISLVLIDNQPTGQSTVNNRKIVITPILLLLDD